MCCCLVQVERVKLVAQPTSGLRMLQAKSRPKQSSKLNALYFFALRYEVRLMKPKIGERTYQCYEMETSPWRNKHNTTGSQDRNKQQPICALYVHYREKGAKETACP